MDDPYRPPETPFRFAREPAGPGQSPPASPPLGRGQALFLAAVLAIAGASASQASGLLPALLRGNPRMPPNVRDALRGWCAISAIASCSGLLGGYLSLRRGSTRNLPILAFLLLYSLTVRVENVSFNWPFQLHAGLVFGRFGIGLNLAGAGMILWWRMLGAREEARGDGATWADEEPSTIA